MRQAIIVAAALLTAAPHAAAFVVHAPLAGEVPASVVHAPDLAALLGNWGRADVTTPIEDAVVSGALLLEGTARAEPGYRVASVAIFVDHRYLGHASGTESWSFPLDTTRFVDGLHLMRVVAYIAPADAVVTVVRDFGTSVWFETSNALPGEVLYERTVDTIGGSLDTWTTVLRKDYHGLRVLVIDAGSGDATTSVRGELLAAYQDAPDAPDAEGEAPRLPSQTWAATYGHLAGASATLSRPPHDVLEAGGVLSLSGAFAGDGRVTVRVEALPVASA